MKSVQPPPPVLVADLFPQVHDGLMQLLHDLSDDEWIRPTVCPGWDVKDVTAHLLGVELGNLSRRRDGYQGPSTGAPTDDRWEVLVDWLADYNERWVEVARRMSPRVLCDLLDLLGNQMSDYVAGLDPMAIGSSVAWAGPDPAVVWLDVAREYTERWVHQQQIRNAVHRPGLTEPQYLAPVLATFVRALPRALREVETLDGTALRLIILGPAGGTWLAVRRAGVWILACDEPGPVEATVTLDDDTAWRLFTNGIARSEALRRVEFAGDGVLGLKVLDMVSIIA